MHLDVHNLRDFYYRSALGRAAQASLRSAVLRLWPRVHGHTLIGFGFAVPVLRPYLGNARRVLALMPGPQGVMPWPLAGPNISALINETLWPIETGHVDRLIVMHGLEASERAHDLLEECWRVLGPGGRALFIVPNRTGLWARRDRTPFGSGRPYSAGQLEQQLRAHQFLPERSIGALYQVPSTKRFWVKSARVFERIGRRTPGLVAGGALIIEVSKKVYPPKGTAQRWRLPAHRLLNGAPNPIISSV